jgi:hypothetical protein
MKAWTTLKRSIAMLLITAAGISAQTAETAAVDSAAADTSAAFADSVKLKALQVARDSMAAILKDAVKVSGDISGTWSADKTYLVTETLVVGPDDSLIIPAGTAVYFDLPKKDVTGLVSRHLINVLGYLAITGNDSQKVNLRSASLPGPRQIWGGIIYVGNRAEGLVEHVKFSHADIGVQIRKGLVAEAPASGSAIKDTTGVTGGVDYEMIRDRPTGPVAVRNCIIEKARFNGIVLVGVDSTVIIENNLISGCSSGISCESGASPIIRNNIILDSYSTGIICSDGSSPNLYGTTVIRAITAGIICANGSSPVIDRCVVAKSGIGVSVTKSTPRILNSTIADNEFAGIIANEGSEPSIIASNVRDNGLCAVDNRSTGMVRADRCWWGFILPEKKAGPIVRTDGYVPFLDADSRRFLKKKVDAGVNGKVIVTGSLNSPSVDAPGTPLAAQSLTLQVLALDPEKVPATGTITNGDTILIEMKAKDTSRYLEDQGPIVISTSTGDPEGTQQVLKETEPASGTYRGMAIASLIAGDPQIVVKVQNDDLIKVQTGTVPPITESLRFVSKPPRVRRLRINGGHAGERLIEMHPRFTWEYFDNENDPQSGTQLELSTDAKWKSTPVWKHEEAGHRLSYTYDGPELERGTTYHIRVRVNDSYSWGPWRASRFHMNLAPPTPELAFPADNAVVRHKDQKPKLAVTNVKDVDGDAVSYIFEAYYDSTFNKAGFRVGGRQRIASVRADTTRNHTVWLTMPHLYENTKVWWRAKATDGLEESDWSTARVLTLDTDNDFPTPFKLKKPRPLWEPDTCRSVAPRFEWEYTYDPDARQFVTFVLSYGRDAELKNPIKTVRLSPRTDTRDGVQFFDVPLTESLEDNSEFYWTVDLEQDGNVIMKANSLDSTGTPPKAIWKFLVDTGNDPPRINTKLLPEIVLREDGPREIILVDSMNLGHRTGYRIISDADNRIDELVITARSSAHIGVEARSRGIEKILKFVPEKDWFGGPESILARVTDPGEKIGFGHIMVRVVPVNDRPVTTPLPDMKVQEDEDLRIDLNPYVSDVDNRDEQIKWAAATRASDRKNVTIRITRGTATLRGTKNFFGGPVPIRFTARDPGGLASTTTLNLTVTAVNDEPIVRLVKPITLKEDQVSRLDLDSYVTDPDNKKSELIWTARPDEPLVAEIDPTTHVATVHAPKNWSGGERRVHYTVKDPAGLPNSLVVKYKVNAVNDAPVIASIPLQTYAEDDSLVIDLDPFVSDVDNMKREMRWTVRNAAHIFGKIDHARRRLVLRSPRNWYGGPETIALIARDPGGLSATAKVKVSVTSITEAPVFATIPAVNIKEDGSFVIALDRYLSDPDHTNRQLTINVTKPEKVLVSLNKATRRLTVSAPKNWNGGPQTVGIEAVDPDKERATTSFGVTVAPVNDPPILKVLPQVAFNEDESTTLTLTEYVTDPDNTPDQMTWTFVGNKNVKINVAGGVATFTAGKDWNGTERLRLTVSDPGGLTRRRPITVRVKPVNDKPVVSDIAAISFDEDKSHVFSLYSIVTDVDNTKLSLKWKITGNTNVKVHVVGRRATISGAKNWNGTETLTFSTTDPGGLSDAKSTTVTINAVNDPPVLKPIAAVSFNEDESATLTLTDFVADPDNTPDQMTWKFTGNSGVKVAVTGGIATFSAGQDWNGTERLRLTVNDPAGLTSVRTVVVTAKPVNDKPVLSAVPAVTFEEDKSFRVNLYELVTDVDNTKPSLKWVVSGNTNVRVRILRGQATITGVKNWNGTESLTFTVSDRGGLSDAKTTTVTINAVNDPPVLKPVPAIAFDEDQSGTLVMTDLVTDPDNTPGEMKWAFTGQKSITASIAGGTATFSAGRDWNGTERLTLTVTDPGGLTASRRVTVRLKPVNDAPVLAAISPVTFKEDEASTLQLHPLVTDVDNAKSTLRWAVSGNTNVLVSIAPTTGVARIRAKRDWNGTETLTFTVTDAGGLTATGTTTVTVEPVNDPPVIKPINPVSFREDESTTLDLAALVSDVDGDPISWTAESGNPNLTATVSGAQVGFSAAKDWSGGPITVALTATDGKGGSAKRNVRVRVTPVNDPPVLRAIPPVTIDEDGSTTLTMSDFVTDPDNTPAQMAWSFGPRTNVRLRIVGSALRIWGKKNWSGDETIEVTVRDPRGLKATTSLSVTVRSVNDAPVVTAIPAVTLREDEAATVDLAKYGSDVDGDALTWSATSTGENLGVSVDGSQLTISGSANWSGRAKVTVTATDPAAANADRAISVRVTAVNDAPTLDPLPAVTFDEDGVGTLDLSSFVGDVDHRVNELTWRVTGGSRVRARILGTTATFRVPANWNGTETLTITVRDPARASAQQQVVVTVKPVNDNPTIRAIRTITFREDASTTVDLAPYGKDIDGDALTWSVSSSDPNVTASVSGSSLSVSAAADWSGSATLTITATDPSGGTAERSVRVRVTPVNDAPKLNAIPPVTFEEDGSQTVELGGMASDVDNPTSGLTWRVSGNSRVRVSFSGSSATFRARANWNGSETVTITVRDAARASAQQQVTVTVNAVNDAPRAKAIPATRVAVGSSRSIDLSRYASDVDGDPLSWSVKGSTTISATITGTTLQISVPATGGSSETINLEVRDSSGATATTSVQVIVPAPAPATGGTR